MKRRLCALLMCLILPVLAGCSGLGLTADTPIAGTPAVVASVSQPTTAPTQPRTPTVAFAPTNTAAPAANTQEPSRTVAPVASATLVSQTRATPTGSTGSLFTPTPGDQAGDATSIVPTEPTLTDPLAIELQATVVAAFSPTVTPADPSTDTGGIEGVNIIPITPTTTLANGGTLWAVFSYGLRRFDPEEKHFIAIYQHSAGGWQQLSKLYLDNPDIIELDGVQQVNIEPKNSWLMLDSGVGAHGGCTDILRFDGKTLHDEVSQCGDSPYPGAVLDLNGDGMGDVLMDQTDSYVFCYACGVRYVSINVLTWDGAKMAPVKLKELPTSAPTNLRTLTNQAVNLAQHELWKDALATISQTVSLNAQDPTYAWDAALIKLTGQARADEAANGPFPLLTNVFYGDYPAALNVLRGHTPADIFDLNSALYTDSGAADWASSITDYMTRTTTLALQAEPNLAGAYYLRGWSYYISDPTDSRALADIQKAASLDSSDDLFSSSLAYLKKNK